jgi:hypothetical protein
VSLFRPARKIVSPNGNEWEVYVSRYETVPRFVRARLRRPRSTTVRIEAVTYYPRRESLLWTTSVDHAERVLRQISAGLEAGDIVRPLGGDFVGRRG